MLDVIFSSLVSEFLAEILSLLQTCTYQSYIFPPIVVPILNLHLYEGQQFLNYLNRVKFNHVVIWNEKDLKELQRISYISSITLRGILTDIKLEMLPKSLMKIIVHCNCKIEVPDSVEELYLGPYYHQSIILPKHIKVFKFSKHYNQNVEIPDNIINNDVIIEPYDM